MSRIQKTIDAIDKELQFAPKACRKVMKEARAALMEVLDDKKSTPEQQLADLMYHIKPTGAPIAYRRRLPDERAAITYKFTIADRKGYLSVGEYEDGSPGELFLQFGENHASRDPLLDQFAIAVSMLLQVGVPIETLVHKFRNTRFAPSGFTGNPDIPLATSPLDHVFAWIAKKYVAGGGRAAPEAAGPAVVAVGKAGYVFERCRGDGKHGCGHAKHVGSCKAVALAPAGSCRCTGSSQA